MHVLNFYALGKNIPENAVYIGRASHKHGLAGSRFANPFPMASEADREAVVDQYRRWLANEIKQGRITRQDLADLNGKDLVCYCAPKKCHGDVLRSAVQWAVRELEHQPVAARPASPRQ